MWNFPPSTKIYLAVERIDGRKGIPALSILVRSTLLLDPLSGHVFVFISRRGNSAKLLYWDHNGYVLVNKRLERGTFSSPHCDNAATYLTIASRHLLALIAGFDLRHLRERAAWLPPSSRASSANSI